MRRHGTSIHRQLMVDMTVLVLVLGIAITLAMLAGSRRAVGSLVDPIIRLNVRSTRAELHQFFNGPVDAMQEAVGHFRGGLVQPVTPEAHSDEQELALQMQFANYFQPVLSHYEYIAGAIVADEAGREIVLMRTPDGWRTRVMRRDLRGGDVHARSWLPTSTVEDGQSSVGTIDYDPRDRPWFRLAMDTPADSSAARWTDPYMFYVANEPGITVSRQMHLGDGVTRVIAFDLLLQDISRFTQNLEVSPRGTVAILTGDGRLIGLPRNARFDDATVRQEAYLKKPAEVGLTNLVDAVAALDGRTDKTEVVRFTSQGTVWWGRDSLFPLDDNRAFRVVVLVPDEDLLGHILQLRTIVLSIVGVVLLIGLGRAMVVARRFSQPIEALVAQSGRISQGDLSPGEPIVSGVREIRALAEAQDTMREGLAAVMRLEKIERDLDLAQEIQQGLLPASRPKIPGFELAGWNQPADETGGDYFDWLQHADDNTVITLADVTGHGIGPALIMAVCRAYMRAATLSHGQDLRAALRRVNGLLRSDLPDGRFVTAVLAFVEPASATVRLISAGHAPLYYFEAATQTVHVWDADDLPLGIVDVMDLPEPRALTFKTGDMLVLLTDGFMEWRNDEDAEFGSDRVCQFLREHQHQSPDEMIAGLYAAVRAFAPQTTQGDDLTAVILKKV